MKTGRMQRLSRTMPMFIAIADDELIADENAMIGIDDKDVTASGDGVRRARHPVPVHHGSVLQEVSPRVSVILFAMLIDGENALSSPASSKCNNVAVTPLLA